MSTEVASVLGVANVRHSTMPGVYSARRRFASARSCWSAAFILHPGREVFILPQERPLVPRNEALGQPQCRQHQKQEASGQGSIDEHRPQPFSRCTGRCAPRGRQVRAFRSLQASRGALLVMPTATLFALLPRAGDPSPSPGTDTGRWVIIDQHCDRNLPVHPGEEGRLDHGSLNGGSRRRRPRDSYTHRAVPPSCRRRRASHRLRSLTPTGEAASARIALVHAAIARSYSTARMREYQSQHHGMMNNRNLCSIRASRGLRVVAWSVVLHRPNSGFKEIVRDTCLLL
jgi:hypothetical protein